MEENGKRSRDEKERGNRKMRNDPIDVLKEHIPAETKEELNHMANSVLEECKQNGILTDFFARCPDAAGLIRNEILHICLADRAAEDKTTK